MDHVNTTSIPTQLCAFGCGPINGMHVWTNHTMNNYNPDQEPNA